MVKIHDIHRLCFEYDYPAVICLLDLVQKKATRIIKRLGWFLYVEYREDKPNKIASNPRSAQQRYVLRSAVPYLVTVISVLSLFLGTVKLIFKGGDTLMFGVFFPLLLPRKEFV